MDGTLATVIGGTIVAALSTIGVLGSKGIEAATARKAAGEQRTEDERAFREELRGDNLRLETKIAKLEESLENRHVRIFAQEQEIVNLKSKCSSSDLRVEIAVTELARCKNKTRAEVRKELFNGSSD